MGSNSGVCSNIASLSVSPTTPNEGSAYRPTEHEFGFGLIFRISRRDYRISWEGKTGSGGMVVTVWSEDLYEGEGGNEPV